MHSTLFLQLWLLLLLLFATCVRAHIECSFTLLSIGPVTTVGGFVAEERRGELRVVATPDPDNEKQHEETCVVNLFDNPETFQVHHPAWAILPGAAAMPLPGHFSLMDERRKLLHDVFTLDMCGIILDSPSGYWGYVKQHEMKFQWYESSAPPSSTYEACSNATTWCIMPSHKWELRLLLSMEVLQLVHKPWSQITTIDLANGETTCKCTNCFECPE